MEPNDRSVHSKQALAVYAESLVEANRVAVFGNAAQADASRFIELGARTVEIWDPDAARARVEAERSDEAGVTVRSYSPEEGTPLRSVDLAVVPDLGLFDDTGDLIARIREMVGEGGVAVFGAANRDAPRHPDARAFDYYELFDLVAAEFEEVRMVAEVPFSGLALIRLGDADDPQTVTVDSQLADPDRTADAFVVIASQEPIAFDPYTIIELPALRGGGALGEVEVARSALAEALDRAQTQQRETHHRLESLQAELRAHVAAAARASGRNIELEGLLRDQTTRALELEGALVERARHLSELSAEVEETRATAEAGRVAAADIEAIARRADRAEHRIAELEHELVSAAEAHASELVRFEEGLRERAVAVRALEAELRRREKMVRELASAVEEALSAPAAIEATGKPIADALRGDGDDKELAEANARLREQLNALALDVARREGEAQAAAWTVAELERRLAQSAPPPETQEPGLRAALDELDALRKALAQEHEARRNAEASERLARAEVARQAELLEQTARDVGAGAPAEAGDRPL